MWRSPSDRRERRLCPVLSEAANKSNQYIPAVATDGEGWRKN
ncbi:MAG: hypothetical protein QHH74_05750 [Spirochaetota bacterium]|nr:hypothetical protein [Spirochaetota bacterium]